MFVASSSPRRPTLREAPRRQAGWLRGRWRVGMLSVIAALPPACAQTSAQPAPPAAPSVVVAPAIAREVVEWDEFTGRIEPVRTVEVRPRVSGYVERVSFTEGSLVRAGQELFRIDARPFQAEVDRLRAEVARARVAVEQADVERARAERLREHDAIAIEAYESRVALSRETHAALSAAEAALRAAELQLEFTRVTAPIAGRVSRALVTEGNLVSSGPGDATLLTTVVSVDPVYAYFRADERILLRYLDGAETEGGRGQARQGLTTRPIRMAIASDEGFPREGRLDFFDNQLSADTGSIVGRAVFDNPDGDLVPGLFVRLRIAGTRAQTRVLIRDEAVGTDLDKSFVYVVGPDDTVEYRAVSLGPVVDGLRVVRGGLEPGERVVVSGLQRVRPGIGVTPEVVAMDRTDATATSVTEE
jgi:multidrug efflux system membrane fusion protein